MFGPPADASALEPLIWKYEQTEITFRDGYVVMVAVRVPADAEAVMMMLGMARASSTSRTWRSPTTIRLLTSSAVPASCSRSHCSAGCLRIRELTAQPVYRPRTSASRSRGYSAPPRRDRAVIRLTTIESRCRPARLRPAWRCCGIASACVSGSSVVVARRTAGIEEGGLPWRSQLGCAWAARGRRRGRTAVTGVVRSSRAETGRCATPEPLRRRRARGELPHARDRIRLSFRPSRRVKTMKASIRRGGPASASAGRRREKGDRGDQ